MTQRSVFEVAEGLLFGAAIAVAKADYVACRAFVYRVPRDLLLDTLFGPAEEIEYARTTAPSD